MKNKKGFTLVELLAVIAILAILVVVALPNVLGRFNQAKKNLFIDEVQTVYKEAKSRYIDASLFGGGSTIFSSISNDLDLSGEELKYCVITDTKGEIEYMKVANSSFYAIYDGTKSIEKYSSEDAYELTDDVEFECFSSITVFFDTNGAKESPSSINIYKGEEYGKLPTVTKDGYTFDGWYLSESFEGLVTSTTIVNVNYDHTLYAKWKENDAGEIIETNILVSFNTNGAKESPNSITVNKGETYGTLPSVTKDGYTFDGWYLNESFEGLVVNSTIVEKNKNHILYAKWKANNYTVTFDSNYTDGSTSSKIVTYGSEYGELPTIYRSGYVFDGWFTEKEEGTSIDSTSIVNTASNHTLYAHWYENNLRTYATAINYKIKPDKNTKNCTTVSNYTSCKVTDCGKAFRLGKDTWTYENSTIWWITVIEVPFEPGETASNIKFSFKGYKDSKGSYTLSYKVSSVNSREAAISEFKSNNCLETSFYGSSKSCNYYRYANENNVINYTYNYDGGTTGRYYYLYLYAPNGHYFPIYGYSSGGPLGNKAKWSITKS